MKYMIQNVKTRKYKASGGAGVEWTEYLSLAKIFKTELEAVKEAKEGERAVPSKL